MSQPQLIEYDPTPLVGSVTLRRSGDQLTLTVHPTFRRVAPTCVPFLCLTLFAFGLFMAFYVGTRGGTEFPWGILAFPLFFLTIGILSAALNVWPMLFPVVLEVTPDALICRWRTLTQANSINLPRVTISNIRADRVRVTKGGLRRLGLVVSRRDSRDTVILRASRRELEFIAAALRGALGITHQPAAGMDIPAPRACRFGRLSYADGVAFIIPPPHAWLIALLVLFMSSALAAIISWRLFKFNNMPVVDLAAIIASLPVGLIAGAFAAMALWSSIRKCQRTTTIVISSSGLSLAETSIINPLDAQFPLAEIAAIRLAPIPDKPKTLALEILANNKPPLTLLQGERQADIEWLATILNLHLPSKPTPAGDATVAVP
jgi:hypothetical protein